CVRDSFGSGSDYW
nr:immunoglobulin heavy chain junction region [Macaca mulatta]MOW47414.1 immunoglobulin heavy chain junction region [Macaca mulatta]MOW47490.1 immunoglobulin heavy chain junction region [Macaca mulatta]MOW47697.1 immunoglobulin heavy chain junction region [Macaca mulatta]MOW48344.1 immunoglobulin heavy chain junction region [Macaca mulatta]